MSQLERSIQQLCPDGVEYKPLGEVVDFTDGFPFKSEDFTDCGNYQVIKITDIFDGKINKGKTYIKKLPEKLKKDQLLTGGEVVVAMSGSTGKSGYNTLKNTVVNQRIAILRNTNQIDNGFLKHLLVNGDFEEYCFKNGTGPQNNISKSVMLKYSIPVPPLEVQQEIARILDQFTELTAELTTKLNAELAARKKQYEHYRDSLLTFDHSIPWVTIGEIATEIYRGSGIKRDEVTHEGIPCVRYGEIYTSYDISFKQCISHTKENVVAVPRYFEYGDIIFAITGESVDEIAKSIAYLGHERCMAGGDTVVLKHKQDPRYLSYALSTTAAQIQKSKGKVKSKVVHSSIPALREIKIPLPDLKTQIRIADILDTFYNLCNNTNACIPEEIETRRKQYEYYRDKLLMFKERKL